MPTWEVIFVAALAMLALTAVLIVAAAAAASAEIQAGNRRGPTCTSGNSRMKKPPETWV